MERVIKRVAIEIMKEIILDGYKKCGKCKKVKLIENFGVDKNRKDKLKPYCKICRKLESNKEKDKIRKQKWYLNNKKITVERASNWSKNNSQKRRK